MRSSERRRRVEEKYKSLGARSLLNGLSGGAYIRLLHDWNGLPVARLSMVRDRKQLLCVYVSLRVGAFPL